MEGSISYPLYPDSFNAKRRLFPKVSKHVINEKIRLGVKEIILEHELGRGEDQMKYTYYIDTGYVQITYTDGKFHAYVNENSETYNAPIETDITFDYVRNEFDREIKVKSAAKEEMEIQNKTKETIENHNNFIFSTLTIGIISVLVGILSLLQ